MIRSILSQSKRRGNEVFQMFPQAGLHRHPITAIQSHGFSSRSFAMAALPRFQENKYREMQSPTAFLAAVLTASVLSTSLRTTYCHEEMDDDVIRDDDLVEEEDPYDNLPEEDEPTNCSICLTYRQGPCRPYWRKVERCTKDNELKKDVSEERSDESEKKEETVDGEPTAEDNEAEPPCLKYMLPWIECASGHRNLYTLIELDTNYTAGIADLEKDATMEVCWAASVEPMIDWTAWQAYVASHPEWKLPKRNTSQVEDGDSKKTSLWKTLDMDKDPELVEITAAVPVAQDMGILECAYAIDQDGNVLGFSYGTKPSEAANQKADEEEINASNGEESNTVELKIKLLPFHTRRITIAAAYTQPLKKSDNENSEPESHIFKSRSFSLKKMGKPVENNSD